MQTDRDLPGMMAGLRYSTAVHEAGHAIVAQAFGLPVLALRIGEEGAGGTDIDDRPGTLIQKIAVCLAGMQAVELLDAGTHCLAGFSDETKLLTLLDDHPEPEQAALREQGETVARDILHANRDALVRVASKLASDGTMGAADFDAVVQGAS